jgi:hypothetical protein
MLEILVCPSIARSASGAAKRETGSCCSNHSCTKELSSSHPRGLSDYSLVKERVTSNVRVPAFARTVVSFARSASSGEAEYYRRASGCQRGVAKISRDMIPVLKHAKKWAKLTTLKRAEKHFQIQTPIVTVLQLQRAANTVECRSSRHHDRHQPIGLSHPVTRRIMRPILPPVKSQTISFIPLAPDNNNFTRLTRLWFARAGGNCVRKALPPTALNHRRMTRRSLEFGSPGGFPRRFAEFGSDDARASMQ